MTQSQPQWAYEYLPYTAQDGREIRSFRIYPLDAPEAYIAETNEHLPADTQQRHACLIAMAPVLLAVLLQIKCMAGKHSDAGYCPYTQLELIEDATVRALADAIIGASP